MVCGTADDILQSSFPFLALAFNSSSQFSTMIRSASLEVLTLRRIMRKRPSGWSTSSYMALSSSSLPSLAVQLVRHGYFLVFDACPFCYQSERFRSASPSDAHGDSGNGLNGISLVGATLTVGSGLPLPRHGQSVWDRWQLSAGPSPGSSNERRSHHRPRLSARAAQQTNPSSHRHRSWH